MVKKVFGLCVVAMATILGTSIQKVDASPDRVEKTPSVSVKKIEPMKLEVTGDCLKHKFVFAVRIDPHDRPYNLIVMYRKEGETKHTIDDLSEKNRSMHMYLFEPKEINSFVAILKDKSNNEEYTEEIPGIGLWMFANSCS